VRIEDSVAEKLTTFEGPGRNFYACEVLLSRKLGGADGLR
jgi:hypothetical protein